MTAKVRRVLISCLLVTAVVAAPVSAGHETQGGIETVDGELTESQQDTLSQVFETAVDLVYIFIDLAIALSQGIVEATSEMLNPDESGTQHTNDSNTTA